jgi:hypothetical protein
MSQDTKKEALALHRLLDFAADAPLTPEEAKEELVRDGVDVDAAVSQALAFVAARRKEARLAWQTPALEKARAFRAASRKRDYSGWDRADLLREVRQIEVGGFRNFEEMTDDDLRTLLADRDELAGDEEP